MMVNHLRPFCHGGVWRLLLPVALLVVMPSDAGADEAADVPQAARALSVAPLDQAVYPEDRPAWIDDAPLSGSGDDVWPVQSSLRGTAEEARESLRIQMQGAAAAYAEQFLGDERARLLDGSVLLLWELEEIGAEDRYRGTAEVGDQTLYEEAVRLRFDEPYRQHLAAAWQQREVGRRLSFLGIAGGAGLCVLLTGTGLVRRMARPRRGTE